MFLRFLALVGVLFAALPTVAAESKATTSTTVLDASDTPPPPQPPHPVPGHDVLTTSGVISGVSSIEAKQALLEQKLSDVNRLQQEIEQLRNELSPPHQILVHIELLEVSLTELKKFCKIEPEWLRRGLVGRRELAELESLLPPGKSDGDQRATSSGNFNFTKRLKANNLAKVLASPQIVVVSGRTGELHIGSEEAMACADNTISLQKIGTTVTLMAKEMNEGVAILEFRVRTCERDSSAADARISGRLPLKVRACDSSATVRFKEPIAFAGLVQTSEKSIDTVAGMKKQANETALLVILMPELVTADDPLVNSK